ncbi:MAG: hypothetical protein DWQ09_17950 [Proteobacteria bacterium]|nr:MAG: hypothetical protein DWQ09_17950 [Pseudomonadota bacterium]
MKTAEERLVARFRRLNENDRETVLALAEFLAGRAGLEKVEESIEEPLPLGRPDHETVVAAMRRLRSTYPMIEAQALLHRAAGLLAEHTLQGRDAEAVIDDLEATFAAHYERFKAEKENN